MTEEQAITITPHAIERWMERSGTKNPKQAEEMLRKMLCNSEEVDLKPEFRAIQLLNHGLKDARYFLHRSAYKRRPARGRKWLLVVVDNELKTVHNGASKSGAQRWQKKEQQQ